MSERVTAAVLFCVHDAEVNIGSSKPTNSS